jgi:hypothetical protein
MDQASLVMDEIDAGQEFLEAFEHYAPVRAAFWLKADEDSGWYLYVASDQFPNQNLDAAYSEVLRLGATIQNPNFDAFQVNLIRTDDPLAQAALDINRRITARVPTRIRGGRFGGSSVEGVYVYPPASPGTSP